MNTTFPKTKADFPCDRWHMRRFNLTMKFLKKHLPAGSSILDLGTQNRLSLVMSAAGYCVINTRGEDLDLIEMNSMLEESGECLLDGVTAFEILEHLVNPFCLLTSIPTDKLIASVPLRLWFAKAYNKNKMDRHFHEAEEWQWLWLLDKAGWKVIDSEKHTSPSFRFGIRTILRWFTKRWLFVYCERKEIA